LIRELHAAGDRHNPEKFKVARFEEAKMEGSFGRLFARGKSCPLGGLKPIILQKKGDPVSSQKFKIGRN